MIISCHLNYRACSQIIMRRGEEVLPFQFNH
uniref:Uncharacterized protein n=1 Tax=Rhizophora mucronata TaxID=61149 RepID=A0A2P2QZQ9_RHIMU